MTLYKTLIGKNDYLFLINDSGEELQVHCNNRLKVNIHALSRYTFKNYFMFVYPNKSYIYKEHLPDEYSGKCKHRPSLNVYKNKFKSNLYDLYEILKDESDVYYKTDTHINFKGNYIVYKYFIEIINFRLDLNIIPEEIELSVKTCELSSLKLEVGDLTEPLNLGDQELSNTQDNFYYNDNYFFYCVYKIDKDNDIRFLDYNFNDKTVELDGRIAYWDIMTSYIIYKKNDNKIPLRILIFYDSFLLSILPLLFDLFNEIYFIKTTHSNDLINFVKPDYVFEFRVERFLT
jgi:hypothetical protein